MLIIQITFRCILNNLLHGQLIGIIRKFITKHSKNLMEPQLLKSLIHRNRHRLTATDALKHPTDISKREDIMRVGHRRSELFDRKVQYLNHCANHFAYNFQLVRQEELGHQNLLDHLAKNGLRNDLLVLVNRKHVQLPGETLRQHGTPPAWRGANALNDHVFH